MADIAAAKRYAQAAFGIARDTNTIEAWRADLADIAAVLTESSAAAVFADGRIPLERRLALVERALDIGPQQLNLARLLVSKGRAPDAGAVSQAFNTLADEHAGIEHATLTSAVPLTQDQVRAFEQRLSTSLGKHVQATAITNPAILGGVVIRVGDHIVDGSIRTRLRQLRRQLEGAR
ncbi:MAG: ATP synthase F1 subunit delta [Chloroflexi bacterium]|nr:ATP synthase F1 subunit delta [Chloroflexota bacterium]